MGYAVLLYRGSPFTTGQYKAKQYGLDQVVQNAFSRLAEGDEVLSTSVTMLLANDLRDCFRTPTKSA